MLEWAIGQMAPRNVQVAISVVTWATLSVGAASRFVGRGCEARRFPNAGDPAAFDLAALTLPVLTSRIPAACNPADLVPTALDLVVLTARTPAARTPAARIPASAPAALARVDP